ncbi:MAG: dynamin family protein [Bacillota bacterium]|nr:dynamin family protein [Bacillota bacterium]
MDKAKELRNRTAQLLQAAAGFAGEYKLQDKAKKLNMLTERLKKGITVVLVCGEFKRGKSSFINALVEAPGICPVDIDITTNIATQVHFADKEYARVHYKKESGREPVTAGLEDIPNYVTEQNNKENREEIQFVEVGLPKENLDKNMMVIVDTPGVGSLSVKHSEVTAAYLSSADVLLFVCDATSPLTTAELDFIKRAYKYTNNIYFILTKIDMVRGWKQIEAENRNKISECLNISQDEVKIYPVSSLNKLDYLATGDEESLEDSRFPELEAALEKELQGAVAKNILLSPLLVAKSDVSNLLSSVTTQYKAFQQGNSEKRDDVEKRLAESNEQYKLLQKTNSKWQLKFSDNSMETKRKIRKAINDGFLALEKDIKEKVKDKNFRDNSDTANGYIKTNILDLMRDVDSLLSDEISDIKTMVAEMLGKEIDISINDITDFEINDIDYSVFGDQRGSGEKVRDIGKSISSNTIAITTIGTLAGSALKGIFSKIFGLGALGAAGALGTGFLGIAGGIFGIKSLSTELVRKKEAEVLKVCMDMLRENRANCIDLAETLVSQALIQIKEEFFDAIHESMETIEKTKLEINKNLSLNASEVNQKSQKLKEQINRLNVLGSRLDAAIKEVQAL